MIGARHGEPVFNIEIVLSILQIIATTYLNNAWNIITM